MNKSIKEMLREGSSKEDLIQFLEKEITTAQTELAEEQEEEKKKEQAEKELDTKRITMVHALLQYLITAGYLKEENIKDEAKYIDAIKYLEKNHHLYFSTFPSNLNRLLTSFFYF